MIGIEAISLIQFTGQPGFTQNLLGTPIHAINVIILSLLIGVIFAFWKRK